MVLTIPYKKSQELGAILKREIEKFDLCEEDRLGRGLGMRSKGEGLKVKGLQKNATLWATTPEFPPLQGMNLLLP